MSEDYAEKRNRHKTLIVVEGSSGENKLVSILARSFPELRIDPDAIVIYETNIYLLYHEIAKYYNDDCWAENGNDVDLTFIISKIQGQREKQFSVDYTNIILIFDFDPQDPHFSKNKIIAMQRYFNEMTDKGKLFINYPMLESYLHFDDFEDMDYLSRTVPSTIKNGGEYKGMVKRMGHIENFLEFTKIIQDGLEKNNVPPEMHDAIVREIGNMKRREDNIDEIEDILTNVPDEKRRNNLMHYINAKYKEMSFIEFGKSYFDAIRYGLKKLIWITLYKSLKIQDIELDVNHLSYKNVDFGCVLGKQVSLSENCGKLWVLNTSLLIVAEFNSKLIGLPPSFLLSI